MAEDETVIPTCGGTIGCGFVAALILRGMTANIVEEIKADFSALWESKQRGNTIEITTPYLFPDSSLFSIFITTRDDRFIACDGGSTLEVIRGMLDDDSHDDATASLTELAEKHGIKIGDDGGQPILFKDCRERKLISSIVFDVATFSVMAANVIVCSTSATVATP